MDSHRVHIANLWYRVERRSFVWVEGGHRCCDSLMTLDLLCVAGRGL